MLIHPDDRELEASISEGSGVATPIGAPASRFLYEMDLPGMTSVHRALFAGGRGGRCLQPAMASRYAAEIGVKLRFTAVEGAAQARPGLTIGPKPPASAFAPVTGSTVLRVGDFLQSTMNDRWGVVTKVMAPLVVELRDSSGSQIGLSIVRGFWQFARG